MMGRFSSSSYQENPSFSMFFPSQNDNDPYSSYDPVDCTLSLGTPSTRLISEEDHHQDHHNKRIFSSSNTSNNMPGLGWDFLRRGSGKTASYASHHHHHHQPQTSIGHGGDPLLARRCANCDTTSTPLWRNGPRGPKSLCNACGIRFKKEERRATAGKAISGGGSSAAEGFPTPDHQVYSVGGPYYDYNHHYYDSSAATTTTQRIPFSYYSPAANDYTFVDDVSDGGSDVTAASFLSWRLNVADQLY